MTTIRTRLITPSDAKKAVLAWHYSKRMPIGKNVCVGCWEDETFIGVVIFSRGASPQLGKPYGLTQIELCELTRVAFRPHETPITQFVAAAIRRLKRECPGLRLIVSFADPSQGHHGGIYQAGNWAFTGVGQSAWTVTVRGIAYHESALKDHGWKASLPWLHANVDPRATRHRAAPKFRYLYPLDRKMRKQIEGLRKPYPEPLST